QLHGSLLNIRRVVSRICGALFRGSLMDRLIQVKYVLCLDEDNKLTPNTVQRLAGLLDHPSNSPGIDGKGVASGNGIAVCQLITEQSSASRWRFSRALAGATIVPHRQPYPVGNFLCDWLGQAKYNGKGMYDPRVYDVVCRVLPDEVILSHDTVEGAYLRAGFVPHTAITEHIPSSHQSILARTERWIRGDVQNIALVLAGFIGRDFSKKIAENVVGRNLLYILPGNSACFSFACIPTSCYFNVAVKSFFARLRFSNICNRKLF
ncbi:hypothetical protein QY694_19115, partial [Xanthomonas campestris pv. incanae]